MSYYTSDTHAHSRKIAETVTLTADDIALNEENKRKESQLQYSSNRTTKITVTGTEAAHPQIDIRDNNSHFQTSTTRLQSSDIPVVDRAYEKKHNNVDSNQPDKAIRPTHNVNSEDRSITQERKNQSNKHIDTYIKSDVNALAIDKEDVQNVVDKFRHMNGNKSIYTEHVDRIPIDTSTRMVVDRNKGTFVYQTQVRNKNTEALHPRRDQAPVSDPKYAHTTAQQASVNPTIQPSRGVSGAKLGPDRLAQPNENDWRLRDLQHRPSSSYSSHRATPTE